VPNEVRPPMTDPARAAKAEKYAESISQIPAGRGAQSASRLPRDAGRDRTWDWTGAASAPTRASSASSASSSVHGALEWPSRTAADEPSSKAPTFATVSADRAPNAGPRDGVDRACGDIPKVHGVMSRPRSLLASACSHGNSTARPEVPPCSTRRGHGPLRGGRGRWFDQRCGG
jgi:hypothetical protein